MNLAFSAQELLVLATGIAAALCLTAAPIFKSRQMILYAQLGAGLCFAAHYAGLGIAVAAAVNVLGSVQTLAALRAAQSPTMNRLGYALIVLMALVCLAFWQGPISAFSLAAMTLIALARMQTQELRLRLLLLAGGAFWTIHDVVGAAWIALAADVGAVTMGLLALLAIFVSIRIEWRPRIQVSPTIA